MAEGMHGREALIVCSDKNMGIGISIWDLESGEELIHIPTCASPPRGLICVKNQFLVASQVHRQRSFGGGAIFTWSLNRPQVLYRSYPLEPIGPLISTKDELFLVGGALSGNAYAWEISSGRLLKNWPAHHKSVSCLAISGDSSFLVSGADDGVISVWTMISMLDVSHCQPSATLPSLRTWSEHEASVTGLITTSGIFNLVLISSSLDGKCKVWDLTIGRLMQTLSFPCAITAIALDPGEVLLYCGGEVGEIYVNQIDMGMIDNPHIVSRNEVTVLHGHKGSVSALSFSMEGKYFVSAAEDCTVCLWDVSTWLVAKRFDHKKGRVANLVVIPQSSLMEPLKRRGSPPLHFSVLDKAPRVADTTEGTNLLLPTYCSQEEYHRNTSDFQSFNPMKKQIHDLEQGRTPEAIQMMIESSVENRLWAMDMTKHVTAMNKHLRSRLLEFMQNYLSPSSADVNKRSEVDDKEQAESSGLIASSP